MNSSPGSELQPPVIALCGPSGAGKSFLADAILKQYPSKFFLPRVCTTREPRFNISELNRIFLSDSEYEDEVNRQRIVLDHQPFGEVDSPRYGFLLDDLTAPAPLLTEVHPTIIEPFLDFLGDRPRMIFGLDVPHDELIENIRNRDSSIGTTDEIFYLRVEKTQEEARMINNAHELGLIDELVSYTETERTHTEEKILGKLAIFIDNGGLR